MADLTFNVAGVSVTVKATDAELLNELRRFNHNLELTEVLLGKQPTTKGGNLKQTAEAYGVKTATVTNWIKRGLPYVDLDGMNKYFLFADVSKWLTDNQITIKK
ncbi:hypothetical protein AALT52_05865 [Ligilactobacillus faecis]|uniref:DNA-binding protein n=1 Tax=Ligilactobacillus faecis TaxID=762833 RepID=A0ABV4DSH0_9LACO